MAEYNNIFGRAEFNDILLPDQIIREIIQTAPEQSLVLANARRVQMSTKKTKQAVLSSLPDAYWVDGDTGMKQTTKMGWDKTTMTAEELAVIVPIPDALRDDVDINLYQTITPLLVEAIGKKVDEATLFGIDKPSSWPDALIPGAKAANQVVEEGEGEDLGVDVAKLGEIMAKNGAGIGSFASRPGLQWSLRQLRDKNGDPIYTPIAGSPAGGIYGLPLNEVMNGVWDDEEATLMAVNWNDVVIGMRQDITMSYFTEGVITDDEGKVILNLMQQDTTALRVVFRVGFQVNTPLTRFGNNRYPAGVIVPQGKKTIAATDGKAVATTKK